MPVRCALAARIQFLFDDFFSPNSTVPRFKQIVFEAHDERLKTPEFPRDYRFKGGTR
jgi:hypothetical protein